jgi:hypothetical protein
VFIKVSIMYKFKSRVTGDLIMLEPNGRQILTIIGKADTESLSKGIVLPQDMPGAITALQDAIVADENARAAALEQAKEKGESAPKLEGISLKQRALPFIDMLTRCHKADMEIVWGV